MRFWSRLGFSTYEGWKPFFTRHIHHPLRVFSLPMRMETCERLGCDGPGSGCFSLPMRDGNRDDRLGAETGP